MFDLYENIKSICNVRGVSVTKACVESGAGRSVLSNLKNGRCDSLSQKTLEKLANYLGVTIDELAHGKKENVQPELNEVDKQLFDIIKDLPDEDKLMMLDMIKTIKDHRRA